jgi:hypothetical protein
LYPSVDLSFGNLVGQPSLNGCSQLGQTFLALFDLLDYHSLVIFPITEHGDPVALTLFVGSPSV